MSDSVIRVENLSKKYIIGHEKQERYTALRDVLAEKIKGIGNLFNRHAKNQDEAFEDFWALKDVSFEIKQGDRVGIIGRNGAGKSTLLKILSRITEPTSGKISIKGRVASLLEVGTGFHPELTGRENVYLNGAILGMDRVEIRKKFDEIVAFAEVEKFLDTPVKRYSSGMYVRLAFAVAAHLEPEILIVDEVLAVGDAAFQKKCLGKMEDVGKEGSTVLLVSHQMQTITALTSQVLLLEEGKAQGITDCNQAVNRYLESNKKFDLRRLDSEKNVDQVARILKVRVLDNLNHEKFSFCVYDSIHIEIKWVNQGGVPVNPNITLSNSQGNRVMVALDASIDFDGSKKSDKGTYISHFVIPSHFLNANHYILHVALDRGDPRICYDSLIDAAYFSITDPMNQYCIARGTFTSSMSDVTLLPVLECSWSKL
jgi:lipopolysaccharide transport system ATP-binding protein